MINITYEEALALINSKTDRGEKSQKQIAKYLKVRQATVSDWLKGKKEMSASSLLKIFEFLGIKIID